MEYTITWTEEAKEDVRSILNYMLDNREDRITERLSDSILKAAN